MDNKYIYFSSDGSDSHSDFEAQFANTITINPYSQVRMISAHVRINGNQVSIDDTNDKFYVGVDYWSNESAAIPLLLCVLEHGTYNMDDFALCVQKSINTALLPFGKFAGGCAVSFNPNTSTLTVELYEMQLPGCPEEVLPDEIVNAWTVENLTYAVFVEDALMNVAIPSALDQPIYGDYYGLSLVNDTGLNTFFMGPRMLTGLGQDDGTDGPPLFCATISLSACGLKQSTNGEYVQLWFGKCYDRYLGDSDDIFGWGSHFSTTTVEGITTLNGTFKATHRFCLQFNADSVLFVWNDSNSAEADFEYIGDDKYNADSVCTVVVHEYYSNTFPFSKYNIQVIQNVAGNNTTLLDRQITCSIVSEKKVRDSTQYEIPQNNISILSKIPLGGSFTASMTCAYDGDEDYVYNSAKNHFVFQTNPATGAKYTLDRVNLFIDRPITLITGLRNSANNALYYIDEFILDYMKSITPDSSSYDFLVQYTIPQPPNIYGLLGGNISYSVSELTGILAFSGPVQSNASTIPQAYLEIRELPLNNYTASVLKGSSQKFISPIDFDPVGADNKLYTSRVYTAQYLTLSNSSQMVLSSMRVRICDINGVALSLLPNTIITLEIRDNPTLRREQKQNDFMKKIYEMTLTPPTVKSLQMLGTF